MVNWKEYGECAIKLKAAPKHVFSYLLSWQHMMIRLVIYQNRLRYALNQVWLPSVKVDTQLCALHCTLFSSSNQAERAAGNEEGHCITDKF
jgi:hypothetical protein